MIVNYEFLVNEPLDNLITCLNYAVDRVVYFGYERTITRHMMTLKHFLSKRCGIEDVTFIELPEYKLGDTLRIIESEIRRSLSQNDDIYFDITSGDSVSILAFGILSGRYHLPVHTFDVKANKVIDLTRSTRRISRDVPKRKISLDIESYIEMRGGVINYRMRKNLKSSTDPQFMRDVNEIWKIAKKYSSVWTVFSDFIKKEMIPDGNLTVRQDGNDIMRALKKSGEKFKDPSLLNAILSDLDTAGIIRTLKHKEGDYAFKFKNRKVKDCIWDAGAVLEFHVYQKLKRQVDDCAIGVHLDWDGIINQSRNTDVLNEVDVLAVKDNMISFISCKFGTPNKTALYELDTVVRRFGGKYAHKALFTLGEVSEVDRIRANEMLIDIYNE